MNIAITFSFTMNSQMELSFYSLLLLIPFTALCVYLSVQYLFKKHTITKLPLPPGTTGWPFIGETLVYLSMGKKGIPERFIEERKNKYSPKLFKTSLIGQTIAVFGSADGNKFMFSNDKLFKFWVPAPVRKMFPSSETDTNTHDENRVFRSMVLPSIKADALRSYVTIMDSEAKEHLKQHWRGNQEVKVQLLSRLFTFTLACRLFLNVEDPGQVQSLRVPFSKIISGMLSIPINIRGTKFNSGMRAVQELREKIVAIIKQRKIDMSNPISQHTQNQNIISQWLMHTDENGKLRSESDIANKFIALLLAAHDTTTSTITAIVYYLAKLPHVYDKVLTEQMEIANLKLPEEALNWEHLQKMRYSWNVACEALRLCPPFPGTYREAITDFTYEGFLVPKGMKLHWNVNATHKDPKYFPDPDKFDPSRFQGSGPTPYSFVPFGGGAWMCPGKEFVRLEILAFMHHLVTMFKFEMVFPEEIFVYDPLPVPQKGLQIRLYPYKP